MCVVVMMVLFVVFVCAIIAIVPGCLSCKDGVSVTLADSRVFGPDETHLEPASAVLFDVSLGAGLGAADPLRAALFGSYIGSSILNLSVDVLRFVPRQVHSHSAVTTEI